MKTAAEWIQSKTHCVRKNVITDHFKENDIRAIQADAIKSKRTEPRWTRKPPRKEGWYWFKRRGYGPDLVYVAKRAWGWVFATLDGKGDDEVRVGDEWSGPLVPPK